MLEAEHGPSRIAPLLSTTVTHPTFELGPFAGGSGPDGGYTPAQMQAAYAFSSILFDGTVGTGSGETIAIVDAYNDPNIQSDLNTFDSEYKLPSTTVDPGQRERRDELTRPADSTGGWELEELLDVVAAARHPIPRRRSCSSRPAPPTIPTCTPLSRTWPPMPTLCR